MKGEWLLKRFKRIISLFLAAVFILTAAPLEIKAEEPEEDKGSSTQQRITQRVNQHIAIRVGYTPLRVGYLHATQYEAKTFAQGVNIVSVTYSKHNGTAFVVL